MSDLTTTIRKPATSPGYLLQLGNSYYCSRGAITHDGQDWQHLSFEVSGLATDGGASQSANVSILDRNRDWTNFIDVIGIDNITVKIWQMYEVQNDDNIYEAVFSGQVSGASANGETVILSAQGVRSDYAITPRNRWISPFSNVTAGSAVVINGETVRFEA